MNQELQVELERFNNEFRCRVECLEQEVLSQKLNSLTNLEAKSVQTDVYTLKYEVISVIKDLCCSNFNPLTADFLEQILAF